MLELGVNIDHVATVRNARGTLYPSPLYAALVAEQAGASSVTLHLREDRRHIVDRDVVQIREAVQIPMNLEIALNDEMLAHALHVRPHSVCLVPERRAELTTEGGLDVVSQRVPIADALKRLKACEVRGALFIDADHRQIVAAYRCGAQVVELHTGPYSEAKTGRERSKESRRLAESARYAAALGLSVHAGHGLNYDNVDAVALIEAIDALNIGHAIISRALFVGLEKAIVQMKAQLGAAR